ncbi:hypothetical protein KM043_018385 [Ampulex compressa]|nr:hypothetical protein KM043_018385 [Ampulex compressa]
MKEVGSKRGGGQSRMPLCRVYGFPAGTSLPGYSNYPSLPRRPKRVLLSAEGASSLGLPRGKVERGPGRGEASDFSGLETRIALFANDEVAPSERDVTGRRKMRQKRAI